MNVIKAVHALDVTIKVLRKKEDLSHIVDYDGGVLVKHYSSVEILLVTVFNEDV